MKVEIEVENIKTLVDALNNACIAYNDVVFALNMGCNLPIKKLEPLSQLPYEEIKSRQECLMNVYHQLEEIERSYL